MMTITILHVPGFVKNKIKIWWYFTLNRHICKGILQSMHYYFHWLPLNINSCRGGHSYRMQGVYIHHPFFIASAGSILKQHFHLLYNTKKMQWIHDFCSMKEHAKNVNAVFVHLMWFESLISSYVTAPPNVELLQQLFFPTHTHTHTHKFRLTNSRYIYRYI